MAHKRKNGKYQVTIQLEDYLFLDLDEIRRSYYPTLSESQLIKLLLTLKVRETLDEKK